MIVRELNYILNRVPSGGDVKFWVDGPEEHGRFFSVDEALTSVLPDSSSIICAYILFNER